MYHFYRFYVYPSQEAENFDPFVLKLKESGFAYYSNLVPWENKEGKGKYFYFNKITKTGIICVRIDIDIESQPEKAVTFLNRLEEETNVDWFSLLGKVDIIATSEKDLDKIISDIEKFIPLNEEQIVKLKLKHGQGVRLEWLWPDNKAHYIFSFTSPSHEAQYFLEFELPRIEASLLRLDKINSYYREQKRLILKEKEALDQNLSRILHSSTVSLKEQEKQMEELENQLQNLSLSFGVIAGNYSLILEGISRLRELINYSRYLLDKQKEIQVDDMLYEKIFDYYLNKLKDMENLSEGLRISRENYQAAISVIRSKLDILISHENINTQNQIKNIMELNTSIQKQGLIFQFAAGLVEFIVLAYYSHSLWKALAYNAYHLIPGWLQFLITCIFSGITVYLTHLIAEYIQGEKHHRLRIILLSLFLFLILVFIFISSFMLDHSILKH